jgi:hypothetical protein
VNYLLFVIYLWTRGLCLKECSFFEIVFLIYNELVISRFELYGVSFVNIFYIFELSYA